MDLISLTKSLKTQAAVDRNENSSLGFVVGASGQVVCGEMKGEDSIYVKYDITYGANWKVVQGADKGISQISKHGEGMQGAAFGNVVWNFPIDIVFKTISPTGWPRIVISVFGSDSLGRDVAKGYGSMHIPTQPGTYKRTVRLFRPVCASYFHQFMAWLTGNQPEFYDSRFVSKSEGREITRVESVGSVTIQLNVTTRGMRLQGYEDGSKLSSTAGRPLSIAPGAAGPTSDEKKPQQAGTIYSPGGSRAPLLARTTSINNNSVLQ